MSATTPEACPEHTPGSPGTSRSLLRIWATILRVALAAVGVCYGLSAGVNELARRAAAIFVVAALFWATEVLPLYATSLCIVAMCVLFLAVEGGLAAWLPAQAA